MRREQLGVAGLIGFDGNALNTGTLGKPALRRAAESGAVAATATDFAYLAARWPDAPADALAAAAALLNGAVSVPAE